MTAERGTDDTTTGRCLCGDVTYAFTGPASSSYYCHCETCRRQCSAPVTAFVNVPRRNFRFTGTAPAAFQSSPGIKRLFCGRSGSPFAYDGDWDEEEIHLYLGTLDDPSAIVPDQHVFEGERLAWFDTTDDTPRYAGSSLTGSPTHYGPRQ
ncbi:MAG: GFA family protein [Pseudomonadota bacterium]